MLQKNQLHLHEIENMNRERKTENVMTLYSSINESICYVFVCSAHACGNAIVNRVVWYNWYSFIRLNAEIHRLCFKMYNFRNKFW